MKFNSKIALQIVDKILIFTFRRELYKNTILPASSGGESFSLSSNFLLTPRFTSVLEGTGKSENISTLALSQDSILGSRSSVVFSFSMIKNKGKVSENKSIGKRKRKYTYYMCNHQVQANHQINPY